MDDAHDLGLILKSRFPCVVIESHEERRVLEIIERVATREEQRCFLWTVTDGLALPGGQSVAPNTTELTEALRYIDNTPQNGLYVLLDAHPWLDDPVVVRRLREIINGFQRTARVLIFVSPKLELPDEILRASARFKLRIPEREDLWKLVVEEVQLYESLQGERILADKEVIQQFVMQLGGLCIEDARRIVRECLNADGRIGREDLSRIARFKQEQLGAASTISLELDTGSFADVGGLAGLKRWLTVRRKAFLGDVAAQGLEAPRGVLLLGVQGGGKSLAARAVAGSWGLPLLRLDFATLYNKYFGETERNLREALAAAEAMAPCVLWVDEIEKGLANDSGIAAEGGVSQRVLGTLLTWLAERKARVFIVATANNIQALPPELMRKGRLDEIFFVDLPGPAARLEIFTIHLKRRKLDPERFDLKRLVAATEGYAGAEIEQLVVSAIYESLAVDQPVSSESLLQETTRTQPLSVVMAEQVEALREWARGRTVPADAAPVDAERRMSG